MSIIDSLITDRTAFDVGVTEKGSYDWRDLNRVTEAMEFIHGLMADVGRDSGFRPVLIPHRDGSMDTRWREDDESMTDSRLEAYRNNVAALRASLAMLPTTPDVPERMTSTAAGAGDGLTYGGANRIEQIIVDMDIVIETMKKAPLRSGQPALWSGYAVYMLQAT